MAKANQSYHTEQQLEESLEAILDAMTLDRILIALGSICQEKAEHIGDACLAKAWSNAAKFCEDAAGHPAVLAVG